MDKSCSALALVAMSLTFNAAASGAGQDRIPELQRDAATVTRQEILTGCVTRGTKHCRHLTDVTSEPVLHGAPRFPQAR